MKISPPPTPNDSSGAQSPTNFEFAKDSDLANSDVQANGDLQENEPSAADYDPIMDMQEDKLRQDSRQQADEVFAAAYNETQNQDQDVLIPDAPEAKHAAKRVKDEFDMFAEDDGDDMFDKDSLATKKHTGDDASAKAVPLGRANAIDMSMLDDWDDEEGYYKIILGELLENRYHVQLNLGKGMFSGVVRAMDQITKKLVAIKIIRSNETM